MRIDDLSEFNKRQREMSKFVKVDYPEVKIGSGWSIRRVAFNQHGEERWHVFYNSRQISQVPYESMLAAEHGAAKMMK